jgi:hypothetical protein
MSPRQLYWRRKLVYAEDQLEMCKDFAKHGLPAWDLSQWCRAVDGANRKLGIDTQPAELRLWA